MMALMIVLGFLAYFLVGVTLLGIYFARNNEEVTLGEFAGLAFIWPITAAIAYSLWVGNAVVMKRSITSGLQKVFGGQRKG